MKRAIQLILSFFIISYSFSSTAQVINSEPLDAYWKIVERLKSGNQLADEEWQDFLDIEANSIYIQNQGFSKTYLKNLRRAMEVVYMPANDSLLQERLKDPLANWITYKVNNYKVYEEQLKEYQREVQQPGYFDTMYKNAWEWLPKRLRREAPATTIYLLGIENDAIAGGDIMILTLWSAYNYEKLKMGLLTGHEMHHILAPKIDFGPIEEQDKGIIYALQNILNEGSADMICKKIYINNKDKLPFDLNFEELLLSKSDSIVMQLDFNLTELAKSDGKVFKTEKEYRNLLNWSSGHNPGYYMADIIVRNGYKKQLIKNVQNPFEFIYLYNMAARKDKKSPPTFTESSIKHVKELEKKYWVKIKTTLPNKV